MDYDEGRASVIGVSINVSPFGSSSQEFDWRVRECGQQDDYDDDDDEEGDDYDDYDDDDDVEGGGNGVVVDPRL